MDNYEKELLDIISSPKNAVIAAQVIIDYLMQHGLETAPAPGPFPERGETA